MNPFATENTENTKSTEQTARKRAVRMNSPMTTLLETYRRIAAGEDRHGDFLTTFARSVMVADYENLRLLMPAMMGLAEKYKLGVCRHTNMMGHISLEQFCTRLAIGTGALAVCMVVVHQDHRAEVVSGQREACPDLAEVLQKLADGVRDGDGMPMGKHGHTIDQT